MQHPGVNLRALFSDQTESFLQVQTFRPAGKRGRKNYIIHLRLRTAAGEMQECRLMTDDGDIPMVLESEDDWFSYYGTEITSKGEAVRYAFRIITKPNLAKKDPRSREYIYTRTGLKSKTFYTVAVKSGKPCISLALTNSVNANQCYILKEDMEALGLTESLYELDFEATAVKNIESQETGVKSGATYDLQGRPATNGTQGIVIENGSKVLK